MVASRLFSSLILIAALPFLGGCSLGYLLKSGYNQADLLAHRVPVEKAPQDMKLSDEEKRKIGLAVDVLKFAKERLNLNIGKNYSSYVKLDRPYVSWAVSAAERFELKPYLWSFPIVGSVPYKGYFSREEADAEANIMKEKEYDVLVRGVSAYSTLGWFADPLLSSMLALRDEDFVNVLIHESVHATLYIKNASDFNERLATFIGNKGTEVFYKEREGESSPHLKAIRASNEDEALFSEFIGAEIKDLRAWYASMQTKDGDEKARRLGEIQKRFKEKIAGKLKTKDYAKFGDETLNNARLLLLETYITDLADLEAAFARYGSDFHRFLEACKKLEKSEHPERDISTL